MRVRLLGPLEVETEGGTARPGGARLKVLLARLAVEAGRPVGADALIDAVWPDDLPSGPAHALHTLVTRLRRVVPVRAAGGGYALDAGTVDVLEFERLAAEGRRALAAGAAARAVRLLSDALGLWRGEPLSEVASAPFAAAMIVRLTETRLAVTEDLLAARLEAPMADRPTAAELHELACAHPLRERVRVVLMRVLLGEGRRAEALQVYEEFRRLLADELGTDPGAELQALHLTALRSATTGRRGNLKAALTSFVGRGPELAHLGTELGARRLITLVGPGGVGKTRLAVTLAERVADRFPAGAWLVELAPVSDPADVATAVTEALGLRDGTLAEALAEAEALVVLDNCEHLADAAARLVESALAQCRRLRFLATSREPLGVEGEALFPVAPLAADAVDLFGERAAAVRPGFAVTPDNRATVEAICRRIDGLPLGIELAAARTRSLPLDELAERLDDRLGLLVGGRTAAPRHRTLRAVVAWTWELLDDDERRYARRAAVFPAAFSVAAAERVCGPAADPLGTLSALVDKSVLQLVERPRAGYRMLETIRAYGLERLAEAGEEAATRAEHAAYFLEFAERAAPALRTADQLTAIGQLTTERENLRTALDTAIGSGDARTALRLGAALSLWWTMQGEHDEALSRLARVLELGAGESDELVAEVTGGYLLNAVLSGRPAHIDPPATSAATPLAALAAPLAALISDDIAAGLAAIDHQLSGGDPWTRAMLWLIRAMLHGNAGAPDDLRADLRSAITEFRRAGERAGLALTLLALTDASRTGDCVALLEESIDLLTEVEAAYGQSGGAVLQRVWLAAARARAGDVRRARDELTELVARAGEGPASRHLMLAYVLLGDIARRAGELDEAAGQYTRARRGPDFPQQSALLGAGQSQLAVAAGQPAQARRHLTRAWNDLASGMSDLPIAASLAVALADVRRAESEPASAAEVLGGVQALGGPSALSGEDLDRIADRLRAELTEAAYRTAVDRGSARTPHEALAFIRSLVAGAD